MGWKKIQDVRLTEDGRWYEFWFTKREPDAFEASCKVSVLHRLFDLAADELRRDVLRNGLTDLWVFWEDPTPHNEPLMLARELPTQ